MRVEPCCVPADGEALRPPSVATRALFEEARRILDARIVRVASRTSRQQGACHCGSPERIQLGTVSRAGGDSRGSGILTHEGLATRAKTITLVLCKT